MPDSILIAEVDCDEDANKQLCTEQAADTKYPVLNLYLHGSQGAVHTFDADKEMAEYDAKV